MHTHTYKHTCIHTHTSTHAYTYKCKHTHTHTRIRHLTLGEFAPNWSVGACQKRPIIRQKRPIHMIRTPDTRRVRAKLKCWRLSIPPACAAWSSGMYTQTHRHTARHRQGHTLAHEHRQTDTHTHTVALAPVSDLNCTHTHTHTNTATERESGPKP